MNKIKIVFAALTAVVGIGGAYATTHQESSNRAGTTFKWYTPGGAVFNNALTLNQARAASGCTVTAQLPCLRGTGITVGGTHVTVFLKKN